jgi:hypothetical protein
VPDNVVVEIVALLPMAILVGVLLGPAVARRLGGTRAAGSLLAVSVLVILAFTMTPNRLADGDVSGPACLVPAFRALLTGTLLRVTDDSLNVALFVPLGVALALLPWRSRRLLAVPCVALPWLIEGTQLLVPALGRTCQSVDLTTNLLGLFIGLGGGLLAVAVARSVAVVARRVAARR